MSSHPQANKYGKWPRRAGARSLDTEVIHETIRCHLERARARKEIASKVQTACSHSRGLTPPYLHSQQGQDGAQPANPHREQSAAASEMLLFSRPKSSHPSPHSLLHCTCTCKQSALAMKQASAAPRSVFSQLSHGASRAEQPWRRPSSSQCTPRSNSAVVEPRFPGAFPSARICKE